MPPKSSSSGKGSKPKANAATNATVKTSKTATKGPKLMTAAKLQQKAAGYSLAAANALNREMSKLTV